MISSPQCAHLTLKWYVGPTLSGECVIVNESDSDIQLASNNPTSPSGPSTPSVSSETPSTPSTGGGSGGGGCGEGQLKNENNGNTDPHKTGSSASAGVPTGGTVSTGGNSEENLTDDQKRVKDKFDKAVETANEKVKTLETDAANKKAKYETSKKNGDENQWKKAEEDLQTARISLQKAEAARDSLYTAFGLGLPTGE
ncbi:MAG: hypothetical protein HUK21_12800 [Fibrobacteraceae bacterium]|nr:hypothetical protein [Fibrobacteraceae bacterium]